MAKYQKRDLIDNEGLYLTVLEAGNPGLRCQSIQRLAGPLFPVADGCLLVSSRGRASSPSGVG